MKGIKLRAKSDSQLADRVREITISLRRLQGFNHAGKAERNPNLIRKLRKEKAQILTILHDRKRET